jgi:hypothetical protein
VIADRRETGPMTGSPVTRAMSPGGRWAYTLYAHADGTAFFHALDTVRLAAVCVDLPTPGWNDPWNVHMWVSRDGTALYLRDTANGGAGAAIVDTRTWKMRTS